MRVPVRPSTAAALSVVLVCAVVLGVAVSSGALRANTNFNAELLPSAKAGPYIDTSPPLYQLNLSLR